MAAILRLLQKTMRINIIITVVLLSLSGVWLYHSLKHDIIAEMREQLEYQADEIHTYLAEGHVVNAPLINVEKLTGNPPEKKIFGDTLIFDHAQHQVGDYYYLVSTKNKGAGAYKVTVMITYIGWGNYSSAIFTQLLITALCLALLTAGVNYFFNKKIWTPFFTNLKRLRHFSVGDNQPLRLEESDINEFADLKDSLQDLADRGRQEYQGLRQFTENAAHELQTPLGIILSKLDRMSQLAAGEEMSTYIEQARSGAHRLKRLNKSLLLLAKLDNKAYAERKEVHLDQVLQHQLDALEELFASRKITTRTNIHPFVLQAHPYLTEILITNLLSNALRYTAPERQISIRLGEGLLQIANPGPPLDFPEEELFRRFRKGPQYTESTGLGLSIVDQICRLNGLKISYVYKDGNHLFEVRFPI